MTQFESIENLLDPTENEENEVVVETDGGEADGGEESSEETEETEEESEEG